MKEFAKVKKDGEWFEVSRIDVVGIKIADNEAAELNDELEELFIDDK